ncbi:MAG: hypothetical protein WBD30_00005, partial [Bacteroidota bacterium]
MRDASFRVEDLLVVDSHTAASRATTMTMDRPTARATTHGSTKRKPHEDEKEGLDEKHDLPEEGLFDIVVDEGFEVEFPGEPGNVKCAGVTERHAKRQGRDRAAKPQEFRGTKKNEHKWGCGEDRMAKLANLVKQDRPEKPPGSADDYGKK